MNILFIIKVKIFVLINGHIGPFNCVDSWAYNAYHILKQYQYNIF